MFSAEDMDRLYHEVFARGREEGYERGLDRGYRKGYNRGFLLGRQNGQEHTRQEVLEVLKNNGYSNEEIYQLFNVNKSEFVAIVKMKL